MKKRGRKVPAIVVLLALLGGLVYGFWPVPIRVDAARVERGAMRVTVDEDGKTRIRQKYVISAPVAGKLYRIELEEGDPVKTGATVLARIDPGDPALLDPRAQAEAVARVRTAEAAHRQAEASLERASEALELATHEYARARELIKTNATPQAKFDEAEHRERIARADVRSAEFALTVAAFEIELAKAGLISTQSKSTGSGQPETLTIAAPVDGVVLRVLQENAGVVSPGTPLLEIGDPRDLEMEIDVLSTDAVRIRPGGMVFVEHWGGDTRLEGRVRLVEPSAFLKISALGVEEQRVNVIADFTTPFDARNTLGDGYRVEARIVVDEAPDVLIVPSGALFRDREAWNVFRVVNRRAKQQLVQTRRNTGLQTEIVDGLHEGDVVILHPTDKIRDGSRVRVE